MCIIADLEKETLTTENILRYIDDYSMYSYYIGKELELNARYSSPLRTTDENPSFTLFKGGRDSKIYFKDHARDYKGDIFQFVRLLMTGCEPKKVSFIDVLKQIDTDFNLGLYTENGINKLVPKRVVSIPQKERYSIQITSKRINSKSFLDFWKQYDISIDTLKQYNCKEVSIIHYKSKVDSYRFQVYPKTLCIAYQIGGRYKLYFPHEDKKKKFQNDFPENWIEGFLQLKYNKDFVIITKSMKETMFFREHFDWDTVAGKSENTKIPPHLMKQLFDRYKKVYIWLDNDEAGIKAQASYIEKYPGLIPIVYQVEQKDPTDRYIITNKQKCLNEITQLIL